MAVYGGMEPATWSEFNDVASLRSSVAQDVFTRVMRQIVCTKAIRVRVGPDMSGN